MQRLDRKLNQFHLTTLGPASILKAFRGRWRIICELASVAIHSREFKKILSYLSLKDQSQGGLRRMMEVFHWKMIFHSFKMKFLFYRVSHHESLPRKSLGPWCIRPELHWLAQVQTVLSPCSYFLCNLGISFYPSLNHRWWRILIGGMVVMANSCCRIG